MSRSEFHRSFELNWKSSKRFELFYFSVGFVGDVDPLSGMIINLVDVDKAISQLEIIFQSQIFSSRTDAFRRVYDYFKDWSNKVGVGFCELSLSLKFNRQNAKIIWRHQYPFPKIHFYWSSGLVVPCFGKRTQKKWVRYQLNYFGSLKQKFKMISPEKVSEIYCSVVESEQKINLNIQAPIWANECNIQGIQFFDPELKIPLRFSFL